MQFMLRWFLLRANPTAQDPMHIVRILRCRAVFGSLGELSTTAGDEKNDPMRCGTEHGVL